VFVARFLPCEFQLLFFFSPPRLKSSNFRIIASITAPSPGESG
jgi:hypothetical protein